MTIEAWCESVKHYQSWIIAQVIVTDSWCFS